MDRSIQTFNFPPSWTFHYFSMPKELFAMKVLPEGVGFELNVGRVGSLNLENHTEEGAGEKRERKLSLLPSPSSVSFALVPISAQSKSKTNGNACYAGYVEEGACHFVLEIPNITPD